MTTKTSFARISISALILAALALQPVHAARVAKDRPAEGTASDAEIAADYAASQLLNRAKDLMLGGEKERGVKMLETVVQQYPSSKIRYQAYLALGKHFLDAYQHDQAVTYLARLRELEQLEKLSPDDVDMLVESLYLSGVAYFQKREYNRAFPLLRKITTQYPNTVWANQAYYYIGMCHFVQENWNKAIEALSMVGTHIDTNSVAALYAEAGRRFYAKIHDDDLPVLTRMGQRPVVEAETTSGDKEKITPVPLMTDSPDYIGSIPTEVGTPIPNDGTLQVISGDQIATRYFDVNTMDGEKDKPRESKVKVVATGGIFFSMGDYDTRAKLAYIEQPTYVVINDADLDTSAKKDLVTIRVISRYAINQDEEDVKALKKEDATTPKENTPDAKSTDAAAKNTFADLIETKRPAYATRDEITLTLTELGEGELVRKGKFGGSFLVVAFQAGQEVDKTDNLLTCAQDDEIVAYYADSLHGEGDVVRDLETKVLVAGSIDTNPKISQNVVQDETIKARKNIVEATAYLELARIFRDMGLADGAGIKAEEGLDRVQLVIVTPTPIDPTLREQAFKLKWELHLAKDDYKAAIATCEMFNRLYPDSPFVDQALMGIGQVKQQTADFPGAIAVYQQIISLAKSLAKAEAQFRIAECTEQAAVLAAQEKNAAAAKENVGLESALPIYRIVADKYPDSAFAGPALGKVIDYYIEAKDYGQASDLLDRIFQDYPDAPFLDAMLLKWTVVSYRMGDFKRAHEKCSQLLFEYPSSTFSAKAKDLMPKIESKLKSDG